MSKQRKYQPLGGDPMGEQPSMATLILNGLDDLRAKADASNAGINEVKNRMTALETTVKSFPTLQETVNCHKTEISGLRIKDDNQQKDIDSAHGKIREVRDDLKYWSRWIVGTIFGTMLVSLVTFWASGGMARVLGK